MSARGFLDEEKALACIHCGLCLSSCPTFLETGNENNSPRGRIYLMRQMESGRLPVSPAVVAHIDSCLGCRACEAVCPSGVAYGELLEHTREHIELNHRRSPFQTFLRRVLIEKILPFPGRLKLALLPARLVRFLRIEGWLPGAARDALALVPRNLSATPLPEFSPATGVPRRGRVGFIRGCVMSVMFGDTNAASIRLLNRAGYDVVAPRAQGCCGALYAHSGNLAAARACARRNIAAFAAETLDVIVINAAGCGSTLKEYGPLLQTEEGRAFSAKVKDLVEVLSPVAGDGTPAARVTYHDACHLAHAQRLTQAPRELVRAVAGASFVELPESDVCCGSAGSYNLTEPAMAERLRRRKVTNILSTGAQIVVTSNPGCILQIEAGLRNAGAGHIRVMHIADYLERYGTSICPA